MKNKIPVPSPDEIESAYHSLLKGIVSIQDWIHFSRISRFDPRLAEAWIDRLSKDWKRLLPVQLQTENLKQPQPATIGPLLEQVQSHCLKSDDKILFYHWKNIVLHKVQKANYESFLIGVYPFAGQTQKQASIHPIKDFLKWGFYGNDIFINKYVEKNKSYRKTLLTKNTRAGKLESFLDSLKSENKTTFKVSDYIQYCGRNVSKRVAQMQLSNHPIIEKSGNTKSRYYRIKVRQ